MTPPTPFVASTHRHTVLMAGLAAVSFLPIVLRAREALAQTGRLAILHDLVDALANAGDVVKSLVDAIRHMVVAGVEGYDAAKARSTYNNLLETSALAASMIPDQTAMAQSLEDYVLHVRLHIERDTEPKHALFAWHRLTERLQAVLERVIDITKRVEEHRSDFVLKPAYEELLITLGARQALLTKLIEMDPPPIDFAELELVSKAAGEYRRLIRELQEARDQMNLYLEQYED